METLITSPDNDSKSCPDCRFHKVGDHDMFGCTFNGCGCGLTKEFLREYFESEMN